MEIDWEEWPASWSCAEKKGTLAVPTGLASKSSHTNGKGNLSLPFWWACSLSLYRSNWLIATEFFVTYFAHAHWLGQWNDNTVPIVAGHLCINLWWKISYVYQMQRYIIVSALNIIWVCQYVFTCSLVHHLTSLSLVLLDIHLQQMTSPPISLNLKTDNNSEIKPQHLKTGKQNNCGIQLWCLPIEVNLLIYQCMSTAYLAHDKYKKKLLSLDQGD